DTPTWNWPASRPGRHPTSSAGAVAHAGAVQPARPGGACDLGAGAKSALVRELGVTGEHGVAVVRVVDVVMRVAAVLGHHNNGAHGDLERAAAGAVSAVHNPGEG